ncbi:4'-phosphopantetheinyl transferase family protein [Streptomyces sp. NPDC088097]|uniref:4'-phosphopantetheinyl transferase family protein n=1 Tax=Streptomyces sp. NPDC088097 TaxID=3365823 RepID=UPI003820D1E6
MTTPYPPVRPGELHLWWLTVPPAGTDTEKAARLLDPQQRERAARLTRPLHRHRKVMAHAGLRVLLAGHLGTRPSAVRLRRAPCPACGGPHGRPYAAGDHGLEFSMAHAGDGVLYAFARGPVGVDVESTAVRARTASAAARWLPAAHRRVLDALPEPERIRAFLGCWVRTEAYLKGIGTGLAHGLGAARNASSDPAWHLVDPVVPEGFVAAAAVADGVLPPAAGSAQGRLRTLTGRLPAEAVLGAAESARTGEGRGMRDTHPGRRAAPRENAGEYPDALLDELRTAVGRPPQALVAAIASWPAPRGSTAPGADGQDSAGQVVAGQDGAGLRFTPRPRTRH